MVLLIGAIAVTYSRPLFYKTLLFHFSCHGGHSPSPYNIYPHPTGTHVELGSWSELLRPECYNETTIESKFNYS